MKLLVCLLLVTPSFSARTTINIGEYFNLENVDFEIDALTPEEIVRLHPDAGLTIDEFLAKYNYPFESHSVTTEDGYILTAHRIPHGRNESNNFTTDGIKPPVLLLHGLLSNSMDFVNMGPEKALALILADAGYDVWLGNNRGTKWSRQHTTLDPDNITFWDFSFHELGYYDLPAFVDHILADTGAERLSYAGHSQGTTQFFAGLACRPEYNDKIVVMAALAPSAYLKNIRHPLLNLIKDYLNTIFEVGDELGLGELLRYHERLYNFIGTNICGSDRYQWICEILFFLGTGFDSDQWDRTFTPLIFIENDPAGSSWKEVKHYGQSVLFGEFTQYDYGPIKNLERYNQTSPPNYDLSLVAAPVALFSGKNDWLISLLDVDRLESELPNVVLRHDIEHDNFTHLDFLWAKNIYELVNVHILDVFNEYNGLNPQSRENTLV